MSDRQRLLSAVLVLGIGGILVAGISTLTRFDSSAATPIPSVSTNPWLTADGLARAVDLRRSFGLRTDDSWIRFVASDPPSLANVEKYSIPMTDTEVAEFRALIADRQTVLDHLGQFGNGHTDEWGGYYLDGDAIVVLLIDPTGTVEKALRAAVPAPFLVKQARWPLDQLTDLSIQVSNDPWLLANYHILSAGADVKHNTVALEVSTADRAVPAKIADHFKLGDKLTISIDGTGAAVLPKGEVTGRAVDASGKPAAGLDIELVPDIPSVDTGEVGRSTGADGSFELGYLAATGYQIRLVVGPDTTGHPNVSQGTQVGTARVEVEAGKKTNVTITVTWP